MISFFEATYLLRSLCCWSWCSADEDLTYQASSKVLSEYCEKNRVAQTALLKSVFLDVEVEPLKPVSNHTHGKSAAARSTGSLMIDRVSSAVGLEPVFYQGSSSDLRRGRKITRSYHWAKDFMAEQQPVVESPELVAMVDVDYYVDMRYKLKHDFTPHLLYTFQPSRVCRDDGEYKYTFDEDNRVDYMVSGGGHYRHEVWNWTGDSLRVVWFNWLGIPRRMVTYAIERRRIDDDHQLVLLAPLRSYKGIIMTLFARHFIKARELERLQITDGRFTRLTVNDSQGLFVCTGTVGGYSQAKVPKRVDDAIASAVRTSGTKLTLAAVKSKMSGGCGDPGAVYPGAEVLLEYHLRATPVTGPIVSTLEEGVRRFQWVSDNKEPDFDAKPGMVAFMLPLLHGGFVPDMCTGNDQRAVTERVTKLKKEPAEITNFMSQCMDEFITCLLRDRRRTLDPVEIEEVYARQDKPSQRRILDQAQHELPVAIAKNFVKREAYQNVNDPRMISTINGHDKMHYSAFIYSLVDLIKTEPWYAFSKSPKEVADRVTEICAQSQWVDLTDFSRMDGRVSNVAREFERRVCIAAFKQEWIPQLLTLMRSQYMLSAKTTYGIRYNTGFARASGSAETSGFNTLLNAFIAFMGYRRSRSPTGFLQAEDAYRSLGIYGGDDGLSGGLSKDGVTAAARSVGQVLDCIRVPRGKLGVSFLARHYGPDVWFGDNNSCCDIKRQLAKFHLTVALPSNIPPLRKLQEKCLAFSLSDSNTPLIGPFVTAVLKMHPYSKRDWENICGMWRVTLEDAAQYPNRAAEWMNDVVERDLPTFDRSKFEEWIKCAGCGQWFEPPAFDLPVDPKPKTGKAVIEGDLVETLGKLEIETPRAAPAVSKKPKGRPFRPRKPKENRPSRKGALPPPPPSKSKQIANTAKARTTARSS